MKWGVRAGSRWPTCRNEPAKEHCHAIFFPFFLANAAAIARNAGYEVFLLDAVAEDLSLMNFS